MTVHYAIGIKVRDENLASHLTFSWPTADHHDEEQPAEMRAAVENLKTQVAAVGDVSGTPFQLVAEGNWSPKWQEKVFEVAGHLSSAASATGRACTSFLDAVGISIPDQSLERLDAVSELAAVLVDSYRKQTAFALEPDGQDRIEALEEAVKQLKAYATAQSDLSCAYEPMAWRQLDGREIDRLWQEAEAAWWPKSSFLHRVVIKNMKKGGAKGTPDPKNDAALLTELRVKGEAIDALDKQLSIFKDWDGHATSPETVLAIHDLGIKARVAVGKLTDDVQSLAEVRGKIRTLMYDDNDLLAPETSIGRSAQVFMRENQELQQAQKMFESISGGEVRKHFSETQQALSAIKEAAEDIASRSAELHDWCGWRRRRSEAIDLELGPLVNAIENGRVPTDDIMDTFEAAYCSWWSGAIIGEDDVLRTFSTRPVMEVQCFLWNIRPDHLVKDAL